MKKIKLFVLFMISFVALSSNVFAATTTTTTTVPAVIATQEETTTVVNDDFARQFKADGIVDIKESVDDTLFTAGNLVTVNSNVNGIGFVAGNTINRSGSSDYEFIAGNNITVTSLKTKDIFIAGNIITISNSNVRTAYIVGSNITAEFDADKVYVMGENVTLKGTYTNVYVGAEEFKLDGTITNRLKINDNAKTEYTEDKIGKIDKYHDEEKNIKSDINLGPGLVVAAIVAKITSTIIKFINYLIVGFIFIGLFKKSYKVIEKQKASFGFYAAKAGIGFLTLIIVPIVSIILLITGFASLLGGLALLLYLTLILTASIFTLLYLSKLIFNKMNPYLSYLIVTAVFLIIKLIPIIGGLLSFIVFITGIGLLIHTINENRKEK